MKHIIILLSILFISVFNFAQVNLTSSNLPIVVITQPSGQTINDAARIVCDMGIIYNGVGATNLINNPYNRSEERSVGNDCRSGVSAYY